jgi:hypothetical protein
LELCNRIHCICTVLFPKLHALNTFCPIAKEISLERILSHASPTGRGQLYRSFGSIELMPDLWLSQRRL